MATPQAAPYGSWKSPITSELIVSATIGLGQVALDGEDVYWIEMRPTEGGRNVIVRRTPDGRTTDVTPSPFNVRTRAHEYGGGAFVVRDGTIYFAHFADQRLYRQAGDAAPQPLTPAADLRYAYGVLDRRRNRNSTATIPGLREPRITMSEPDKSPRVTVGVAMGMISSPPLIRALEPTPEPLTVMTSASNPYFS